MKAILRGIKNVEYTKRDTGEFKRGLELHCLRKPFPLEPFVEGSDVVFTEYLAITDNSQQLVDAVLKMPFGAVIDLQYVQNGRFSSLVDVNLFEG